MLEHTTLEKVTSFTQATEPRYLALASVYFTGRKGYPYFTTSAISGQQAYILCAGFKSRRCWDSGVDRTANVKIKAAWSQTGQETNRTCCRRSSGIPIRSIRLSRRIRSGSPCAPASVPNSLVLFCFVYVVSELLQCYRLLLSGDVIFDCLGLHTVLSKAA